MKRVFSFFVGVCMAGILFCSPSSVEAQGAFKIGGGIFFDGSMPGGAIAVDIPVGEGNFAISPFADFFTKSGTRLIAAGVNFMVKKPAGDKSKAYFGAGGGLGHVNIDVSQGGVTVSASKAQAMANVLGGLEFSVGEKAAIFAQAKWIGTFGGSTDVSISIAGVSTTVPVDAELRNFALEAGIAFSFGE